MDSDQDHECGVEIVASLSHAIQRDVHQRALVQRIRFDRAPPVRRRLDDHIGEFRASLVEPTSDPMHLRASNANSRELLTIRLEPRLA